jgi:hypothetical protein
MNIMTFKNKSPQYEMSFIVALLWFRNPAA